MCTNYSVTHIVQIISGWTELLIRASLMNYSGSSRYQTMMVVEHRMF